MNQSFEESYNGPLIENSLFQLPIEEIGPLFCFGNDGRTTNETQKIQKINSAPEKKEVIQKDNMNKTNTEKINDNNNMLKRKRKLGRRTNEEKENQKIDEENAKDYHTKYRKDNLQKKIKHISIYSCFKYVNEILKNIYDINSSKDKLNYQLLKLDHYLTKETKVEFNKSMLENTMKWILTNQVSTKYKKFPGKQNQYLLEDSLLKCTAEDKKKLELLLNMKYKDYLDLYRGNKPEYKDMFKGLVTFEQYCKSDDFIKSYSDHENYKKCLEEYLNGYEKILENTRQRKPKKKKDLN